MPKKKEETSIYIYQIPSHEVRDDRDETILTLDNPSPSESRASRWLMYEAKTTLHEVHHCFLIMRAKVSAKHSKYITTPSKTAPIYTHRSNIALSATHRESLALICRTEYPPSNPLQDPPHSQPQENKNQLPASCNLPAGNPLSSRIILPWCTWPPMSHHPVGRSENPVNGNVE